MANETPLPAKTNHGPSLTLPTVGIVAHAARRLVAIFSRGVDRTGSLTAALATEALEAATEIGAWAAAARRGPAQKSSHADALVAPLFCPACKDRHVDEGLWARRPHHTHLCIACGFKWRVEPYTFGEPAPIQASETAKTVELSHASKTDEPSSS